jgi:hypothetical protein
MKKYEGVEPRSWMETSGQLCAQVTLSGWKDTHYTGGWVGPRDILDAAEKIQMIHRSSSSKAVIIVTELSRLDDSVQVLQISALGIAVLGPSSSPNTMKTCKL